MAILRGQNPDFKNNFNTLKHFNTFYLELHPYLTVLSSILFAIHYSHYTIITKIEN